VWATGSLRRHWVELAWLGFAAINVLVIVWLAEFETIPFHFVWVSLTIVYGIASGPDAPPLRCSSPSP
jgi:hypothetical protein